MRTERRHTSQAKRRRCARVWRGKDGKSVKWLLSPSSAARPLYPASSYISKIPQAQRTSASVPTCNSAKHFSTLSLWLHFLQRCHSQRGAARILMLSMRTLPCRTFNVGAGKQKRHFVLYLIARNFHFELQPWRTETFELIWKKMEWIDQDSGIGAQNTLKWVYFIWIQKPNSRWKSVKRRKYWFWKWYNKI